MFSKRPVSTPALSSYSDPTLNTILNNPNRNFNPNVNPLTQNLYNTIISTPQGAQPLSDVLKDELLSIVHLFLATVVCWFTGYFGWSFLWCIILFYFSYVIEQNWIKRKTQREFSQLRIQQKKDKLRRNSESLEWVQLFLNAWWPVFVPFSTPQFFSLVTDVLGTLLSKQIGAFESITSLHLKELSLGDTPIQLKKIKSYILPGSATPEFDIEIDFPSDIVAKLDMKMMGIDLPIVVDQIHLKGRIRAAIKMDLSERSVFPLIQDLTIAFKSKPYLSVSVKPLKVVNIMSLPVIESKIKQLMEAILEEYLILPAQLTLDLKALLGYLITYQMPYEFTKKRKIAKHHVYSGHLTEGIQKKLHMKSTLDRKKRSFEKKKKKLDRKLQDDLIFSQTRKLPKSSDLVIDDRETGILSDENDKHSFMLKVKVLSGKDLTSADFTGKSDPYCIVRVAGETQRTRRKRNTLNPVWNEVLEFELPYDFNKSCPALDLQVMDSDRISRDDFLGVSVIDISDMKKVRQKTVWAHLKHIKSGRIHLELSLYDN